MLELALREKQHTKRSAPIANAKVHTHAGAPKQQNNQQQSTNRAASLRDIANKYALSFFFLQKVARKLREKGLTLSSRGKQGGYTLSKAARDITLNEIFSAIEGPIRIKSCFEPQISLKNGKTLRHCHVPARKGLSILNTQLQNILHQTTLADFLEEKVRSPRLIAQNVQDKITK